MNNEDIISRAELLEIAAQQGHVTVDDIINAEAIPPPVAHGRWIKDKSGVIYCSECGEEHAWLDFRATYCDACGAKMDLEED